MKCEQCEGGWHGKCENPSEDVVSDAELGTVVLCCCHDLDLWFDAMGIERWPNGQPYEPVKRGDQA